MDVRLPKLGEGAESGTVVSVFVKEGDQIQKGQTILELENEKAVAPIPSPVAGKVGKLRVKEGDKLSVGQVILSVENGATAAPAAPAEAKPAPARAKQPEASAEAREPEPVEDEEAPAESGSPPAASPTVRKIARELGIDLARIRGSEPGGRIVMADLRAWIQRLQKSAAQPGGREGERPREPRPPEAIDFSKWGEITKKALSPLRKTISDRLSESWRTIPHVTQFDEADITGINDLRKKFATVYEKSGARLTLTSFALKAVVETLKKHPLFNASFDEAGQEIVYKEYYHIGVAVDTEQGLIVPVIRDVNKKSMLELSRELNDLAEKARARKVSLQELQGGTFTISNQGGIGGAHFTPIINKPEVAILGLGRGVIKSVVRNGKIEPRLMMPLGLSYDHRVIDGGAAARCIEDLVQAFENFPEKDAKI
ncbi:MAG TPA: 2-oxo acid dehydrogenase subunit E2 [Candidatus Binatia bacterium]|nr:2-oxo acid dehydrogenase subunit E2 [Candidatus Binatia bacterium]